MRIALLHAWAGGEGGGGGGSRVMLDLALMLDDMGHEVVVACHDFVPVTEHRQAADRLEFRWVRRGSIAPVRGAREALSRFWIDMKKVADLVPEVDVIDAHEWPALRAGGLAARRLGVPFVWHRNDHTIFERAAVRDPRHGAEHTLAGRTIRLVASAPDFVEARRAGAIVTVDEDSRRLAERVYRRPALTIPAPPADHFFDPPDREDARARFGIANDEFLILGVGIMAPHRRFEDLIDAVAEVEGDKIRVKIIGSDHVDPGYGRFVRERVSERRQDDRVDLQLRSVSEDELRGAYAAADLFVFPNDHRQSYGLAPLEALAAETPVLLTTAAGVADAIRGQPGVTIVDPLSPRQLAGAIREFVANPRRARASEWVFHNLGLRGYADRNLQVFSDVVATHAMKSGQ